MTLKLAYIASRLRTLSSQTAKSTNAHEGGLAFSSGKMSVIST